MHEVSQTKCSKEARSNMKKILAAVVSMAMVLGMITPAFATTTSVNANDALATAVTAATTGDTI